MATPQREISEGIPTDGRIFEPPQINRDNEQPRYLTFVGSLIDPDTARSRWWTKGGGIEISNPCLRYVKNFLRKGRITPLLKDTHDFQPYDKIKKTMDAEPTSAGYFAQPIPAGYVPPALPPATGVHHHGFGELAVGGPSPYGSLLGKLALPGEQIHAILTGPENLTQTNIQRGIVELTTLKDQPYRPQQIDEIYVDPSIWQIQRAIFPTYPNLPVKLDDIELLLDDARAHSSLREIVDEMHNSLIQFRDYADATIQQVHATMRESVGRGGYVWRYTSMDLVLLEQLGMERQDRAIRQQAQVPASSKMEEMFAAFLQAQTEEKQALADMYRRQGQAVLDASQIDSNTMAAAPISEPTEPEVLPCACGEYSGNAAGMRMHKNRWCKLREKGEPESVES